MPEHKKKPWLNFKSDGPERVYAKPVKIKRTYKSAMLWLLLGGWSGAHRFYLWDYKQAISIMLLYILTITVSQIITQEVLGLKDETAKFVVFWIYWLLIVVIEKPKLESRVMSQNEKYLLK